MMQIKSYESETKKQKEALIVEAVKGIELTTDESRFLDWLFSMDMYTVSAFHGVMTKARCLDAKAK